MSGCLDRSLPPTGHVLLPRTLAVPLFAPLLHVLVQGLCYFTSEEDSGDAAEGLDQLIGEDDVA